MIILLVSEAFLNYTVILGKRKKNKSKQLAIVVHICNSSTREKETRESGVQGHLWLHYEFKVILGHIRSCFDTTKIEKKISCLLYTSVR